MLRIVGIVLAASIGSTALANEVLGPEDVWPSFAYGICDSYQLDASCLSAAGAPPGALRFMQAAMADPEIAMLVVPISITELGEVDLLMVEIPGMANTNSQQMLVNGDPSLMLLTNWADYQPPGDAGSRAVLRRYPQASPSGRIEVQGHRLLPGGIQRFVMTDILTDGCRGCDIVGASLFQLDFRDGALVGLANLGWVLSGSDSTGSDIEADLRAGDAQLLQVRLNLLGYDAGAMDGVAGSRTREALAAFQADYCLPREAALSAEAAKILAAQVTDFVIPPCAAALAPRLTDPLGLADGRYVTDARLCPPEDAAFVSSLGDRISSSALSLKGDQFSWGESICAIGSIKPYGVALDLAMVCMAEGMFYDQQERVTIVTSDSFYWRSELFSRCDAQSAEPEVDGPVFPLRDIEARVNTAFGAAGPGSVTDPSTYFTGQYHAAVDLRAAKDEPVFAPFAGTIVYDHRLSGAGKASWLQSFFVLRDSFGRDWIFGHVDCTVCPDSPQIGDNGAWPKAAEIAVSAGHEIGRIADLSVDGFPPHLHLGLSTLPVVDNNGQLLASYRAGNWARLLYEQGSDGALEAAAAQGVALGFIDPLSVLRP